MSATIINLIIQLIAGAVGGNAAGAASKDISLGTLGNTIAGAVGGVGGGQLLGALIPMMAGAGNNVDIGALRLFSRSSDQTFDEDCRWRQSDS
jgi:uncharacterized membrane protein YeaQ/YmgE (transglycosylase-associated protein family)